MHVSCLIFASSGISHRIFILLENPQQGAENRDPLPNPWGGSGSQPRDRPPSNILNTPAMQSLLQQMSDNPSVMTNLLNAPYTRSVLEAMQADPNMASNVSILGKLEKVLKDQSNLIQISADWQQSDSSVESSIARTDENDDASIPTANAEPRNGQHDD